MQVYKRAQMAVLLLGLAILLLGIPVQASQTVQVTQVTGVEEEVTLELKGADIRDVLQMLAKLGDINVVADKSVSGEVSVALNKVPFNRALDMVIKANGFEYRWMGDILFVTTQGRMASALEEPIVRSFTLKHILAEDAKEAISVVVDAGNLVAEAGSRTLIVKAMPSQLSTIGDLLDNIDVATEAAKPELITRTITLKNISADDNIAVLREAVGADVLLVPKNKALVVRGSAEQVAVVQELLTTLDQPEMVTESRPESQEKGGVTQQPNLLTKVVYLEHATSEAARQALTLVLPADSIRVLAEDRTLALRGTTDQLQEAMDLLAHVDKAIRQVVIEARVEEISLKALRDLGIDWTAITDDLTFQQVTKITDTNFSIAKVGDVTATLKVLEETGDSTVLANPKVAVLDGQEANIHIGDRVPIVIDKKETDANGNVVITTTVEYIDAGIMLKVAPRINSSGYITTRVKPEVSSITGQTEQGYPEIRTRTAETTMTLTDGETIMLGGLIQEEEIETLRKVPLLGDIPILGKLFQTRERDKRQTEIVIFLTPKILPLPGETVK